jgi:hypothetical protein
LIRTSAWPELTPANREAEGIKKDRQVDADPKGNYLRSFFFLTCSVTAIGQANHSRETMPAISPTANPDALLSPDSSEPTFEIAQGEPRQPVTVIAYGDMRFTSPTQKKRPIRKFGWSSCGKSRNSIRKCRC